MLYTVWVFSGRRFTKPVAVFFCPDEAQSFVRELYKLPYARIYKVHVY